RLSLQDELVELLPRLAGGRLHRDLQLLLGVLDLEVDRRRLPAGIVRELPVELQRPRPVAARPRLQRLGEGRAELLALARLFELRLFRDLDRALPVVGRLRPVAAFVLLRALAPLPERRRLDQPAHGLVVEDLAR